ncbi:type I restriction endonuclease [Pyrococcus kukulkanii]|uniref:type I restriction endonuclease n=1 Tax=Pyrococcus kukulkanii TaxID=1609559 RepID=UPI00356B2C4E
MKDIIARILSLSKLNLYRANEEATKQHLILPLLQSLGWDVFSPDEVVPEVNTGGRGRVDYALYIDSTPVAYIEAKSLGVDVLRDRNALTQLGHYCFVDGVGVGILTNGIQWVAISAFEVGKRIDDRTKIRIDLRVAKIDEIIERLSWFSKDKIRDIPKIEGIIEVVNRRENLRKEEYSYPPSSEYRTIYVTGTKVDTPDAPTINELIHVDLRGRKPTSLYVKIGNKWWKIEIVGGENWRRPPKIAWSTILPAVVVFLLEHGYTPEDVRIPSKVDYLDRLTRSLAKVQVYNDFGTIMPSDGNATLRLLQEIKRKTGVDIAIEID